MSIVRNGLLALSFAVIAGPAFSEEVVAPARILLSQGPVDIRLEDADLVVRWDAVDQATLDFWWTAEENPGRLSVDVGDTKSTLRSLPDEAAEGHAVIEINLVSGQSVNVEARRCSVDAVHPGPTDIATESHGEPGITDFDATLTATDATLTGIPGARLTTVDGVLFASGGTGSWRIEATGGSSELQDHSGDLHFVGSDSNAKLDQANAKITIESTGGSFRATGIQGSISAILHQSDMSIEGSRATVDISGDSSTIELFDVVSSRVKVAGDRQTLRLEGGEALTHVTIVEGSLTVRDWRKRLNLTLRDGTSAVVEDIGGDVAFTVHNSTLELRRTLKHVRGTATGSRFDAEDLRSLELDADDADITIYRVKHFNKLVATDSQLALDLPNLKDKRTISLLGTSTAEVSLPQPCQVRFFGVQPGSTSHASVNGCDALSADQDWRRQRKVHPDEPDLVSLGVSLDSEASIRVVGR